MMKFRISFFIIFVSFILLLSGCSSSIDCSSQDTNYVKYEYNSETKLCEVSEQIQKDVCGNGIIEEGENYCSCSKDVTKAHPTLGCQGDKGDYLELTCSAQDECVMAQNSKVVEQTKSLEFKNSDVVFSGRVTLNSPFIQNTYDDNKVDVVLELFKLPSTSSRISNVVVDELLIENSGGILFASQNLNKAFTSLGAKTDVISLSLNDITEYEDRETLRFKIVVSYVKDYLSSSGEITKTENKIETLSASLGTWNIVNSNFLD